jgi:hypothetical protein
MATGVLAPAAAFSLCARCRLIAAPLLGLRREINGGGSPAVSTSALDRRVTADEIDADLWSPAGDRSRAPRGRRGASLSMANTG